jgi:hypothetical protein
MTDGRDNGRDTVDEGCRHEAGRLDIQAILFAAFKNFKPYTLFSAALRGLTVPDVASAAQCERYVPPAPCSAGGTEPDQA